MRIITKKTEKTSDRMEKAVGEVTDGPHESPGRRRIAPREPATRLRVDDDAVRHAKIAKFNAAFFLLFPGAVKAYDELIIRIEKEGKNKVTKKLKDEKSDKKT